MFRRLYSDDQIARISRAAVRVLGEMGIRVQNQVCLDAMGRFGARVNYAQERAILPPDVIDRALEIVRSASAASLFELERLSSDYSAGGDGSCPLYYREDLGARRRATEADCVEALKICDTSGVVSTTIPALNGDVGHRYEAIRCLELAIETLDQTVIRATDLFFPEQVPFAVELGELYADDPAWFLPGANCITSPLTIGKTIADLAVAKAPYTGCTYVAPPMPVMGANAPMTPIGAAILGVAEILGSYVLAKSLNLDTPVSALALCALMDMRGGYVVFCAPEVLAADIAICETMQYHLNLPCRAYGGYADAKLPGMRAIREKLLRSLGSALYSGMTGFSGSLDQGKVFSPTQMILDQELHSFLARYSVDPSVADECIAATEAILDVAWHPGGYLTHEHTVRNMQDVWRSIIYERGPWVSIEEESEKEGGYLEKAQQTWRDNLARYVPPDHSHEFLRELHRISRKAREALRG